MGNYGIKISNEGKDVDSKNVFDDAVNTKYKTFMSKLAGRVDYTFSDSPNAATKRLLATIPHKLGYIPQISVKFSINNVDWSILPDNLYYVQNQICPGCESTCDSNKAACDAAAESNYSACQVNAENAYNAAEAINDAIFTACLEACPYPDGWEACSDQCVADTMARWQTNWDNYMAALDVCGENYGNALNTCQQNYQNCFFACGARENRATAQYMIYATVDADNLYIWFEIKAHASDTCGFPAGTFLNMVGRTLNFKYNIGFSELKTTGEQNAGTATGN